MFMFENNNASPIRVVTGTDIVINIMSKISETNKCSIVLQIKNHLLLVLIIHYSKSCRNLNFNLILPLLKLFNFKCCFLRFFPHFVITLDMKYSDPALWTSFNKLALDLLLLKTMCLGLYCKPSMSIVSLMSRSSTNGFYRWGITEVKSPL